MIVALIAVVLGTLRIVGFDSILFQAIAHVFVGGLGGAWLVGRKKLYLVALILLTLVEVFCALLL